MTSITFGSVCSGIEAASVAWHPLGWRAAWLAEIEPFPSAVLAHHYPDVPNLGDMSNLPEQIVLGIVPAPDVFCGGTPCQAFSVAGLRRSLDDARGNLSLTFCEIANAIDISRAHDGHQPCIVFWENVPGVLNTKDNAFGCFLAGLAGEDDPLVAPGGKWPNAGAVFGPQRTVAWRVLDAQYFGVAQRRRRVFVVASARDGFDPAAVLFEFEGVRRDSAPSRQAGQTVTPTIRAGAPVGGAGHGARSGDSKDELIVPVGTYECGGIGSYSGSSVSSPILRTGMDKGHGCEAIITMAHSQGGAEIGFDRGPTLTCNHEAPIAAYVTHSLRGEGFDASEDGTGRGTPLVPVAFAQNSRDEVRLMGGDGSIVGALAAEPGMKQTCYIAQSVSLRGREGGATAELGDEVGNCLRASGGGGDKAHVLAPVAFHHNAQACQLPGPDRDTTISESLTCSQQAAAAFDSYNLCETGDITQTLKSPQGGVTESIGAVRTAMQVRRLTPRECERLQGFPDDYTLVPNRGKPAADGPRYKALGNSWAVPNVRWIGWRIAAQLHADLA